MSTKNTLTTVRMVTAAEAKRSGRERSQMPAASSTTPKASQTAE